MSVLPSAQPTTATGGLARSWRRVHAIVRGRILARLLQAVVVSFAVIFLTFLLVRIIPGDPTTGILGAHANKEAKASLRAELHLDRPVMSQFGSYIDDLAHGDLGHSLVTPERTVRAAISDDLPVTMAVVVWTIALSCLLGIPLGLLAGLRPGKVDGALRSVFTLLLALPPFFLGLVLLLLFANTVSLLPAGGWGHGWPENVKYVLLPSVALSGYLLPLVARTTREAARQTAAESWVEAAIVRGISERRIAFAHVLPNSLLPVISLVGYNVGALVAGAVVVEAVFGIPGIGEELVTAVSLRDYTIIQGIALVSALIVVAANLIADLTFEVVDPRLRHR